ncbi:hypothetical protein MBLNU230_g8198t1 [Neophaeotheca triangularis]
MARLTRLANAVSEPAGLPSEPTYDSTSAFLAPSPTPAKRRIRVGRNSRFVSASTRLGADNTARSNGTTSSASAENAGTYNQQQMDNSASQLFESQHSASGLSARPSTLSSRRNTRFVNTSIRSGRDNTTGPARTSASASAERAGSYTEQSMDKSAAQSFANQRSSETEASVYDNLLYKPIERFDTWARQTGDPDFFWKTLVIYWDVCPDAPKDGRAPDGTYNVQFKAIRYLISGVVGLIHHIRCGVVMAQSETKHANFNDGIFIYYLFFKAFSVEDSLHMSAVEGRDILMPWCRAVARDGPYVDLFMPRSFVAGDSLTKRVQSFTAPPPATCLHSIASSDQSTTHLDSTILSNVEISRHIDTLHMQILEALRTMDLPIIEHTASNIAPSVQSDDFNTSSLEAGSTVATAAPAEAASVQSDDFNTSSLEAGSTVATVAAAERCYAEDFSIGSYLHESLPSNHNSSCSSGESLQALPQGVRLQDNETIVWNTSAFRNFSGKWAPTTLATSRHSLSSANTFVSSKRHDSLFSSKCQDSTQETLDDTLASVRCASPESEQGSLSGFEEPKPPAPRLYPAPKTYYPPDGSGLLTIGFGRDEEKLVSWEEHCRRCAWIKWDDVERAPVAAIALTEGLPVDRVIDWAWLREVQRHDRQEKKQAIRMAEEKRLKEQEEARKRKERLEAEDHARRESHRQWWANFVRQREEIIEFHQAQRERLQLLREQNEQADFEQAQCELREPLPEQEEELEQLEPAAAREPEGMGYAAIEEERIAASAAAEARAALQHERKMERKRRENNRIMAEIVELKAKQAARGLPVAPRPPPSSGKRLQPGCRPLNGFYNGMSAGEENLCSAAQDADPLNSANNGESVLTMPPLSNRVGAVKYSHSHSLIPHTFAVHPPVFR